ncbi:MAG: branched-chain amino acid ABC transporter permease [Rhizobiaceae bacterium]|nr:branched-chain amino acid ABC transporter permease [Rhizobiaceae bacterium]MCV0405750.1 branched-chain amino acid ABC transporter permease [Rhizobiaceae bacterium]
MTGFNLEETRNLALGTLAVGVAALLPVFDQGFYLAICVNIMLYAALCTAWSLFSGPTHLVSLATAAFYGLGTYSVGLGIDTLPYPVLVAIAAASGAVLAGLVGAMTLRISGVYFVIFTFGLAEFVRQVVTWLQTKFATAIGLYVFTDITESQIYWMLLALTAAVFLTGFLIARSTLGFALQIIGNDETVARHVGIDTARAKIVLFMISGAFIAIAGAIMAPRYSYIEPPSAFNPMISFLVVIMALLGGTRRLWGPLVGVIPFTIMMDFVSSRFPNHTMIVVGLAFLVIVYLIPNGVTGLIENARARMKGADTVAREKTA